MTKSVNGYVILPGAISVVVDSKPYTVDARNKGLYDAVKELLKQKNYAAIPDTIDRMSNLVKKVAAQAAISSDARITIRDRRVYLTDENGVEHRLQGYEITKLIEVADEGFDIQPLANFAKRVRKNPSEAVQARLYEFMEKGQLPLTEDGSFIAYKVVRSNFKDKHSGRFDNSPGQYVSMPREQVDDNDHRTCSTGLHVCSKNYIRSFRSGNDKLVACIVAPEDVVSIPVDYNDAKMRTAAYTVLAEITATDDPAFFGKAVYRPELEKVEAELGTVKSVKSEVKFDVLGRPIPPRNATGQFVRKS